VQCPQPLATYTIHEKSMTALSTEPNAFLLERILQSRHPWLNCVGRTH